MISDALAAAPRAVRSRDRVFYTGMALAICATVLLGFARTFYLRSQFDPTPLALPLLVHGVVFSTWIALLVAQTSLVAAGRTRVHRRLGWAGAVLAMVMIVVALAAAIFGGRRDIAAGYEAQSLTFFATPVSSMLVFATFVGAAVALRGQPDTHKRLMLLATISILDAAIARWPVPGIDGLPLVYYGLTDAFILAAILYDLVTRGRVAGAYLWGGMLIVSCQALRDPVGSTAAWQAFARVVLE